jgi:uracil phosphoribosyltransferase
VLQWGVPRIHVITVVCSEQGLKALREQHPDVKITVACVDSTNAEGVLWPGMGDSGDRLFGTAPIIEDHEALVHPSRRKRSLSQG